MNDRSLTLGALMLFIAVALGAFGAHGLKSQVGPEAVAQWQTGVQYQFYHGFGLVLLAALGGRLPQKRIRLIGNLFVAGILLFSGSIYLLATRDILGTQGLTPVLGPITPLGGLCFLAGWAVLFITAWRRADDR
ncbi:MAG: DUF423 domain-containing protein [Flavobacteriales bacterium]|nr:DUF423 domain-containing protein [Flavobacteriales bacterium]